MHNGKYLLRHIGNITLMHAKAKQSPVHRIKMRRIDFAKFGRSHKVLALHAALANANRAKYDSWRVL